MAVGNVLHRLAVKVVCYTVSRAYEVSPIQLGVSVKGGAKAAVNAVRKFITNKIDSDNNDVTVNFDMKNAERK